MIATHTPGRHLDDAQKQHVIATYDTLGSISAVARTTRHARATIARIVRTAGRTTTPPPAAHQVTPGDIANWVRRYQAGDSIATIAASGWASSTIHRHLRRAGVPMRPVGMAAQRVAKAIRAARTETTR